eukprot:GHRQ01033426.1.p2 GENE.GHRQ01033426.1~~GHRQ01033426.1.p2  ORF type:complete len:101 (-),score=5.72 GHRQ01033426.1:735-1037(-)
MAPSCQAGPTSQLHPNQASFTYQLADSAQVCSCLTGLQRGVHKKDRSASSRLPLCSRSRRSASFLSTSASVAITSMSACVTFTAANSFSLQEQPRQSSSG